MLNDYLDAFFKNLKYVPDGLTEISSPIVQFFLNVINSKVFKILYFIPLAIIQLIRISVEWYFDRFINNEAMLQTPGSRVIFVYIIPLAFAVVLVRLLRAKNGLGLRVLLASPFVMVLFPLFAVLGIITFFTKISNRARGIIPIDGSEKNDIELLKIKLIAKQIGTPKPFKEELMEQMKAKEETFQYALKKIRRHAKVLQNLSIPDDKNPDIAIKIDAVLINKHGVFVWDSKCEGGVYFYGRRYDTTWYTSFDYSGMGAAARAIKAGSSAGEKNIKAISNPLMDNMICVKAIQKLLRHNGLADVHMFSGVAYHTMNENDSRVECEADEAVCDVSSVPNVMKVWNNMSKKSLSMSEVNKIYRLLSQYRSKEKTMKPAACIEKLQKKIDAQPNTKTLPEYKAMFTYLK